MKDKVFLAAGSNELEEKIKSFNINIVDTESNLETIKDLLDYIDIDFLIINRLLDDEGDILINISKEAEKKGIKVIMLMHDLNSFEEKRLVTALVSSGVYSFINIRDLEEKLLTRMIDNYPIEFNFELLAETIVIEKEKIVEKITPVIKEKEVIDNSVISVFSFSPSGKTFLSSILADSFYKRDYTVNLISLDKVGSLNIYFNIKNQSIPRDLDSNTNFKLVMESSEELVDGFRVMTSKFRNKVDIGPSQLNELIDVSRNKYKVSIIDCDGDDEEQTKAAIAISNINILVVDTSKSNILLNIEILKDWHKKGWFSAEKTILVVNRCFEDSPVFNYVINQIRDLEEEINQKFKDIKVLGNYTELNDLLITNNIPSISIDSLNIKLDGIMHSLKSRSEPRKEFRGGTLYFIYNLVSKLFRTFKFVLTNRELIFICVLIATIIFMINGGAQTILNKF
jgi:cellulose biosynthesis protein BcsQ